MRGYICGPRLYEYEHDGKLWLFEVPTYDIPWPLTAELKYYKRVGEKWWQAYRAWKAEDDPQKYRVGGGCQPI